MTHRRHSRSGLTLIELMVTMLLCSILLISLSIIMLESQRGWRRAYNQIHGGQASDAMVAKTTFEIIVRKATRLQYQIDAPDDMRVFYYSDWFNAPQLDRYSRFYCQDGSLYVEHGQLGNMNSPSTVLLATDVSQAVFRAWPGALQMILTINNSPKPLTVAATAVMHNQ